MNDQLSRLKRFLTDVQPSPTQHHWLSVQLAFSSLVIGMALAVSVGKLAGYLGANALERSAIALAGFVYGLSGHLA